MVGITNLTKRHIRRKPFLNIEKKIFKKGFELSIVFAPPFLMRNLNKKYRGKNSAANVLSFLLEKGRGEIFLNSSEKNLPYLFIHGALHLLGYDHKKNKDAKKMEKKEQEILYESKI